MYRGRFVYLYGLLAAFAAVALSAGLIAIALSVDDPVTRTRTVPEPKLTSSDSVAATRSRFKGPVAQSVPGTDIGLGGGTCDVLPLKDGLVLVCHA